MAEIAELAVGKTLEPGGADIQAWAVEGSDGLGGEAAALAGDRIPEGLQPAGVLRTEPARRGTGLGSGSRQIGTGSQREGGL